MAEDYEQADITIGEVMALRGALAEAIEEMEDMLPYVPEYFQEKWGYPATIAKLKAVYAEHSDGSTDG